jgi:ring-1,2-phenylacetyl-CoA epoxidase subunit PaaE
LAVATPKAAPQTSAIYALRVARVTPLTDDSSAIEFEVPEHLRDVFAFAAGQHLTIVCYEDGEQVRRSYSIYTSPTSGDLSIAVKHLPGGRFSSFVAGELAPGHWLDVMPPAGLFTPALAAASRKHYVALAAGSGICPILSILTTVLEQEPESFCTLLYGNRTSDSIMFLEELEDLKDRYPQRYSQYFVLSREAADVPLLEGRLDSSKLEEVFRSLVQADRVDEWFICGPLQMIEAARSALHVQGVSTRHIHRELFHDAGASRAPSTQTRRQDGDTEDTAEVTVRLRGRSSSFPVAFDGEVILDAALRARPDAPFSCRDGVCGTCRCKLVEGEVEMERHYVLEPDELEAGVVLACQSHPKTKQVVLDFDR